MKTKRVLCILLALLLILLTAGCGGEETTKKKKKKIVVIKRPATSDVSTSEEETDESDETEESKPSMDDMQESFEVEENTPDEETQNIYHERELAEKTVEQTAYSEVFVPEYKVKKESWSGPEGYTVVYPEGNHQLMVAANKIKDYFAKDAGVTLKVTDDSHKAANKEILIGDTNRKKSKLSAKEFAVTFDGNKLCFESGNFNGAVKAVNWFTSLKYEKNKVNLLSGSYEFESSKTRKDGVYHFVWGDEFDGNSLDSTKWELTTHMGNYGYTEMLLTKGPEIIRVEDGRLKLSARRWFNPDDPITEYAVCYTVEAKKHANFQYGYLEMKARYPIKSGAWPSWWLSGNCTDGVAAKYFDKGDIFPSDFKAEVDILEYTNILPNLHKWYFNGDHSQYNYVKQADGSDRLASNHKHTEEDSYIYHIFGYEWTPEKMTMYCDGEEFMTFNMDDNFDGKSDMSDFRNPMFVRFNNHLSPDNIPTNKSSLPCDYYIDYVRLYQKSGVGGLWLAE